jgi:uncharacterized protein YbbK (DUF523 family)
MAARPRRPPKGEVRVGISSCLLGDRVRWDGGHKLDALVTRALSRVATLVPVCPEVELGMGVPRPPIRLERRRGGIRLVDPGHGLDHTDGMRAWAERRVRELEALDLSGYVLKSRSPSCGMERVEVWSSAGRLVRRDGVGLFAEELLRRVPLLPVAEEARLGDARARAEFVERVLAYRRMRSARRPPRR